MKNEQPAQQESDLPPKLSAPAQRALAGAGITRLEQLTTMTEADLLKLHGLGPKTIRQLRQVLDAKGLSFAEGKRSK
jgi:DNA-directed RNA polymerase alpha subunit